MAVVRCVRAHPARLGVAQPRDLSLLRFRRPFVGTGGDLSQSTSESHSTYNVIISSIPFQLRSESFVPQHVGRRTHRRQAAAVGDGGGDGLDAVVDGHVEDFSCGSR